MTATRNGIGFILLFWLLTTPALRAAALNCQQDQPTGGEEINREEQAISRIQRAFAERNLEATKKRPVSYRPDDWPPNVALIRAERAGVPISLDASLSPYIGLMHGLTKQGEYFELLGVSKLAPLPWPWPQDKKGEFYWIRTINGRLGYIYGRNTEGRKFVSEIRPRAFRSTTPSKTISAKSRQKAPTTAVQRTPNLEVRHTKADVTGIIFLAFTLLTVFFLVGRKLASSISHSGSSSYESGGSSEYGSTGSSVEASYGSDGGELRNPLFDASRCERAVFSGGTDLRDDNGRKIGALEPGIFSNTQTVRDESGHKVGTIEKSVWGSDQIIRSEDGKVEGRITDDIWGHRIIVDSGGKKVGEFDKDVWGDTIIRKS